MSDFNLDRLISFPNQQVDGDFTECVGIGVCDIITDKTGIVFDPDFTYAFTLWLQGVAPNTDGSDPYTGILSAVAYGVLPATKAQFTALSKGELYVADYQHFAPELRTAALQYAQNGVKVLGKDFDAVVGNLPNGSIGMPMQWFSSFTAAGQGNEITQLPNGSYSTTYTGEKLSILPPPIGTMTNHFVKICGVRTMQDGSQNIIIKPWLGRDWGDGGFTTMSRRQFNTYAYNAYQFNPYAKRWLSLLLIAVRKYPYLQDYLKTLAPLG